MSSGAILHNFGSLSAPGREGTSPPTVTVFSNGTVTNESGASITNTRVGGVAIQGTVQPSGSPGVALASERRVVTAAAIQDQVTVTNAGTISGTIGIQLLNGVDGNITNTGTGVIASTVTGGTAIDALAGGTVTFSNAHVINGSVILGDAATDSFANSATLITGGSITGNLDLGSPTFAKLIFDGPGTQVLSLAVTGTITNFNTSRSKERAPG